jgi:hypothetical protein
MSGCLKFAYEAPNHAPHRHIIMCKQKRKHSTTDINWHNLLSWDTYPSFYFSKKHDFWNLAPFQFSGKEVPNLVDPLDQAILSHWVPQQQ